MTCGSCGAKIADKAIVCYRCGVPTTRPEPRMNRPAARRSLTLPILVCLLAAILTVVGFVLPEASTERMAGFIAAALVAAVGLFLLIRGRG